MLTLETTQNYTSMVWHRLQGSTTFNLTVAGTFVSMYFLIAKSAFVLPWYYPWASKNISYTCCQNTWKLPAKWCLAWRIWVTTCSQEYSMLAQPSSLQSQNLWSRISGGCDDSVVASASDLRNLQKSNHAPGVPAVAESVKQIKFNGSH